MEQVVRFLFYFLFFVLKNSKEKHLVPPHQGITLAPEAFILNVSLQGHRFNLNLGVLEY